MQSFRTYRRPVLAVLVAVFVAPWRAWAEPSLTLDLAGALERARTDNQLLEAARLRIDEARGDLRGASVLLIDNPELVSEAGPRRPSEAGSSRTTDYQVGIEQRLEIAGQRSHRIARARSALDAARASAEDAQRVLELAVASIFYEALAAGRRTAIARDREDVSNRLYEAARLRLERGEGTYLELNASRIRLAEAQRQLAAARATERSSNIRLAELLGLSPATRFRLEGGFPEREAVLLEETAVNRALAERPDLLELERELEAAESMVRLADAEAWPDVTAGIFAGRDERDDILRAGLRVPIPFFNRNQGARHRARAAVRRIRAERDARRLAVESEVRRFYADYDQGWKTLLLYDTTLLKAQEESLDLLERAFAAGQVGYAEVIVVQREVLQGREGYLDAQLTYSRARAALLAASGQPLVEPGKEPRP